MAVARWAATASSTRMRAGGNSLHHRTLHVEDSDRNREIVAEGLAQKIKRALPGGKVVVVVSGPASRGYRWERGLNALRELSSIVPPECWNQEAVAIGAQV